MGRVTPSDKTGDEGEWWRKDKTDREHNNVDPEYEEHIDEAYVNETGLKESQGPHQNPS